MAPISRGEGAPEDPGAWLDVENQSLEGDAPGDRTMRFRFCPKAARVSHFTIRSNVPALYGKTTRITSSTPELDVALQLSSRFPNWWTDDPARHVAQEVHKEDYTAMGAKTVSRWCEDYWRDLSKRMNRCKGAIEDVGWIVREVMVCAEPSYQWRPVWANKAFQAIHAACLLPVG